MNKAVHVRLMTIWTKILMNVHLIYSLISLRSHYFFLNIGRLYYHQVIIITNLLKSKEKLNLVVVADHHCFSYTGLMNGDNGVY